MKRHRNGDNQHRKNSLAEENSCPVHTTMAVISGKWKLLILWQLQDGEKRFGELGRAIKGITQAMLSNQLKALENHGIIKRKLYAEVPRKVEYSLTQLGESLLPVIASMEEWGLQFLRSHQATESTTCVWRKKPQPTVV